MLEGLLPSPIAQGKDQQVTILPPNHIEKLFVFALMWSVGALLELDDRAKMEAYLKEKTSLALPPVSAERGDTIFEYVVNDSGKRHVFVFMHASVRLYDIMPSAVHVIIMGVCTCADPIKFVSYNTALVFSCILFVMLR